MMTETNTAPFDRALLDRLCVEIEIAWEDQRDDTAVDRMAAEHPDYARPLYDFYSLLVAVELDEQPVQAPSNVRSLMEYLTQRTGEKPTAIATKMRVPYPFLLLVQRHPQHVPETAREEIADRAAKTWGVDRNTALRALEHPSQNAIAASRDNPYSTEAPEYDEMIKRAKMNKKEQEYWRSFAD